MIRIPPSYISAIFHNDWMDQWHKGQERNIMLLGKAESILASRDAAKAQGTLQADDEPEEDAEDEVDLNDPATTKKAARKLRETGWTEPTQAEAEIAA